MVLSLSFGLTDPVISGSWSADMNCITSRIERRWANINVLDCCHYCGSCSIRELFECEWDACRSVGWRLQASWRLRCATDWRRGTVATYSCIPFHYLSSWCGILKYPPYESAPVILLLRNFPAWDKFLCVCPETFTVPGTLTRGVYIASADMCVCLCVELNLQDQCVPSYNWWQVALYTMPVLPYVGHDRYPGCHPFNRISEIVGGKVKVSRPQDDKF